ncbi:MAG: cupin domain-containing protein [Ignavibacteriaceae bacterium]
MKKLFLILIAVLFSLNISAQTKTENGQIQLNEKDLVWRSGMPGTLISILEGDPKSDSLYTLRLKIPANYIVKPHSHTSNERVTILSGSVYVGLGDKIDKNNSVKFIAGGYYVNPPDLHHYVWTDEPAEIQITGIGPWVVNYVEKDK